LDRNLHSRVPLVLTPLLRFKRCHACDQWHSSRVHLCSLPHTVTTVNSVQTLKGSGFRLNNLYSEAPGTQHACPTLRMPHTTHTPSAPPQDSM
jgi:hypothetical protein